MRIILMALSGLLLLFTTLDLSAQPSLADEIAAADSRLFTAFNTCDVETQAAILSEDLEFYHDIAGVSGYHDTLRVTKANCDRKLGLTRTLNLDDHRVYPLKDFGAIQIGSHTFCHLEDGKNDCGTFGFTHIWKRSEKGWQVHRVISYDH